jgi:hypothetical protein
LRVGRAGTGTAGHNEAKAALRPTLQRQQCRHHQQQQRRQLGRGNAVVHRQPSLVDARGERLDAEIARNAEVRQRFHESEGDSGGNGRTRQRHGNAAYSAAQRSAEQACRLHQVAGPLTERRSREQVDVGVEREDEDQRGAAEAAHFGKDPALQSERASQPRLQRTAELQVVGVRIGDHIRGHGQGQ